MDLSKTKKYITAEVVFMVVFAACLLVARFMVASKHRIVLSEPVKLESASLSACVPIGGGWRTTRGWIETRIKGVHALEAAIPGYVFVQWRYISQAELEEPQNWLAKRAGQLKSEIIEAGQLPGQAQMDWVQLQPSGTGGGGDIFIGCSKLGYGNVLELEVVASGRPLFARRIFEKVGESITVEKGMYYE